MSVDSKPKASKPSLLQVIASVLAAGFGVQSGKRRERDFAQGSPAIYVVVGVVATLLFVLGMALVVKLVLSSLS